VFIAEIGFSASAGNVVRLLWVVADLHQHRDAFGKFGGGVPSGPALAQKLISAHGADGRDLSL
jgi:hypothetical protein